MSSDKQWEIAAWKRFKERWVQGVLSWAILQIATAYSVRGIYVAATELRYYGGRSGHRHWISYEENPVGFWLSIVLYSLCIVGLVGLPAWIFWRIFRAVSGQSRSMPDSASTSVRSLEP